MLSTALKIDALSSLGSVETRGQPLYEVFR
jgi:hypothetical protein